MKDGWIHYISIEGGTEEIRMPINRIHNTSFHPINSRNLIFDACDDIKAALLKQYYMHAEVSQIEFDKGLVMKLQYRINRSHEKKERTRKYARGPRGCGNRHPQNRNPFA